MMYTGRTADGSDMTHVDGFYVSPDGKEWSSEPYQDNWKPQTRSERRASERFYLKQQKKRNICQIKNN